MAEQEETGMRRGADPHELPQGAMPEPASRPATGTDTVTVACKIPAGIVFPLHVWEKADQPVQGGGVKEVSVARPTGQEVRLRGPGPLVAAMRRGAEPEHVPVGGYALTHGIPRDHWEKTLHDYRDHPAIVNHLVFHADSESDAGAEARNLRSVRTGLEGIDPDDPAKRTGIRGITREKRVDATA